MLTYIIVGSYLAYVRQQAKDPLLELYAEGVTGPRLGWGQACISSTSNSAPQASEGDEPQGAYGLLLDSHSVPSARSHGAVAAATERHTPAWSGYLGIPTS
ncbi:hypothetical protein V501_05900, partial [Pseudogymnoascus sp. VKM F-4519 (FW-2642)]